MKQRERLASGVPPAGNVDSRVNFEPEPGPYGSDAGHRARRAPPLPSHRTGLRSARPDEPQPARRRGDRQERAHDRRGPSHATPAARTRSARRWPPAPRTRPARPCTCRSSRAPTTAAPRPAPRRSSRPASPAWWSRATTRPPRRAAAASASCATRAIAGGRLRTAPAAHAARLINQPFRKHAKTGRPLVVWKAAMTLDGKVATSAATRSGSPASRAARAPTAGAPSATPWPCGIGTAMADDPQLTARVEGVYRQPRRVVFDAEARLPLDSMLVRSRARHPGHRDLLARRRRAPPSTRARGRRRRGADGAAATPSRRA